MHKALRTSSIPVFLLFLVACALSPQTVNIGPDLDLSQANAVGQDTTVKLQVIDNRPGKVIGSRGGVYADTATISTGSDIGTPIHGELVRGLRTLGYNMVDGSQTAKTDLRVYIDAIEYKADKGRVLTDIETAATIRAVARTGNREFTGRYRGMQTREVLKTPSPEVNEELINGAITRVLERMLTDRELLEFMREG